MLETTGTISFVETRGHEFYTDKNINVIRKTFLFKRIANQRSFHGRSGDLEDSRPRQTLMLMVPWVRQAEDTCKLSRPGNRTERVLCIYPGLGYFLSPTSPVSVTS